MKKTIGVLGIAIFTVSMFFITKNTTKLDKRNLDLTSILAMNIANAETSGSDGEGFFDKTKETSCGTATVTREYSRFTNSATVQTITSIAIANGETITGVSGGYNGGYIIYSEKEEEVEMVSITCVEGWGWCFSPPVGCVEA